MRRGGGGSHLQGSESTRGPGDNGIENNVFSIFSRTSNRGTRGITVPEALILRHCISL